MENVLVNAVDITHIKPFSKIYMLKLHIKKKLIAGRVYYALIYQVIIKVLTNALNSKTNN